MKLGTLLDCKRNISVVYVHMSICIAYMSSEFGQENRIPRTGEMINKTFHLIMPMFIITAGHVRVINMQPWYVSRRKNPSCSKDPCTSVIEHGISIDLTQHTKVEYLLVLATVDLRIAKKKKKKWR